MADLDLSGMAQFKRRYPEQVSDFLMALALRGEAYAKMAAPYDTGNLMGEINARSVDTYTKEFSSGVDYAVYNEFGTSRMAARPYMRPALEKVAREAKQLAGGMFG
jgi:HK97 gp10 family phage protein